MNKSSFKEHLASRWYVYVIWAVVVILFWSWIFSLITKPKAEEKLTVFLGAYYVEREELTERFNENNPEYIKQTEVLYYNLNDYNFAMYLTIKAAESDIIILSENAIKQANISRFLPFDEDMAKELFGNDVELLSIGTRYYGIKIYDKILKQGKMTDFIGYEKDEAQDFYLLFNCDSVHTGQLKGAALDGAVQLAMYILS